MEDSSSKNDTRPNVENFGLMFNDPDFADRVLHIEINTDQVQVKSFHVNSAILAVKSPFFYKLFKSGMIESQRRDLTLKINPSEETALMDVLSFIYGNTVCATTCSDLLGVLVSADKLQVTSCMEHCVRLLTKMPMSLESVLLCLELPSTVLTSQLVQPLIDASRHFLVAHYKELSNSQKKMKQMSLSTIEFLLGSEGLRVSSEDDVFEFVLKWGRAHYPQPKERREILTKILARFVCFPHMSCSKLKEVLLCPDFDSKEVSKLVMEALVYKIEEPYGEHITPSRDLPKTAKYRRVYERRIVKVVHLKFHFPRCVVYFDLKKEECADLYPSKDLQTQPFLLGGRWFSLVAQCEEEQKGSGHHFGLLVDMHAPSGTCTLDIEFAAMKTPSRQFQCQRQRNKFVIDDKVIRGYWDTFGIPWATFINDDSPYFIDGILHLRVELTIIRSHG